VVQDVAQEANLRMLGAGALPRSLDAATGWVVTVTRRTVADHLRGKRPDAKWLDPDAEVEQQPGDASDEEFPGDGRLLSKWLQWAVRNDDADREILAVLFHKARTEKTYQDLATEYFTTVAALKSRVHAFKEKYAPRWRRVKATLEVLLLLLGAVVVALVAWMLLRQRPAEIQPDPVTPAPSIAPTTTASAKEPVFEPARPTPPLMPRRNVPEKP
jgi:DNA-directed RNA polymerase specialized sigma24 family protein